MLETVPADATLGCGKQPRISILPRRTEIMDFMRTSPVNLLPSCLQHGQAASDRPAYSIAQHSRNPRISLPQVDPRGWGCVTRYAGMAVLPRKHDNPRKKVSGTNAIECSDPFSWQFICVPFGEGYTLSIIRLIVRPTVRKGRELLRLPEFVPVPISH